MYIYLYLHSGMDISTCRHTFHDHFGSSLELGPSTSCERIVVFATMKRQHVTVAESADDQATSEATMCLTHICDGPEWDEPKSEATLCVTHLCGESEAAASSGARPQTPASSGAAAAKREQLKRRAMRQGLPANRFINEYSSPKKTKKDAREEWVKKAGPDSPLPPEEIWRSYPQIHPRTNFERVRVPGQRSYKKGKDSAADLFQELGASPVD